MTAVMVPTVVLAIGSDPAMLTTLPPAVVVLIIAGVISALPRRAGHLLAVVAGVGLAVWLSLVPSGVYLPIRFIGFDAVLFNVDLVSKVLGMTYGVISAITAAYAYGSGRSSRQTALGFAYAGTTLGVIFAGDWLTLLAFWEVMSFASALLLWSSGGAAVRAGFRYAVFHALGGLFLIGAVAVYFVQQGSFLFTATTGIGPGLAAILAVTGIGVNAGFVAVHTWIPDAYPKSHFVTSVVLCGYTTKTAVYAMYRAFPDGHLLIVYMGVAMTLVGVSYALVQTNMRRLLSYHIQSQVGYMVAGIGLGTAVGVAGGFAHLINNILYKSLLFMVAGVIIYRTGKEDLKKVGGLYRVMPLTFLAFVVAALSIVGVPGFNGYVSKEVVKTAAKKEHLTTLKWLLTFAGIGTTMSFVKFGYYAFFQGESGKNVRDATTGQTIGMVVIAVLCILLGVFPSALFNLLPSGTGTASINPYAMGSVVEALGFITVGVIGFFLIRTRLTRLRNIPDVDRIYNPLAFYGLRTSVNGFVTLSDCLKSSTSDITHRIVEIGISVDPLSSIYGDRVPPPLLLDASVLLLALLTVFLLIALLV